MTLCVATLQAAAEYGALNGTLTKFRVVGQRAAQWGQEHWPWILVGIAAFMVLDRLMRPKR